MISLEKLLDNSVAARNFLKLARLVLDTGGKSIGIRFGTGSIAFAASTDSTQPCIVLHGLGKAPQVIFATNKGASGYTKIAAFTTDIVTSTSFQVFARIPSATTGTLDFYWIAIG